MSSLSPQVKEILKNNKKNMNQTRNIIKSLKKQAPVLSTIVDYGGPGPISDILQIEREKDIYNYNKFEKILRNSNESSNTSHSNERGVSFIDYKSRMHGKSIVEGKRKVNQSKRSLKTSIVVEMPAELKMLKNNIINLPSVSQSRYRPLKNLNIEQERTGNNFQLKSSLHQIRRLQTEHTPSSKLQKTNRKYLQSLQDILSQFNSPQIHCNNYILNRHKQCKRLLQQEEEISRQYKRFEKLGSPPKKIIGLMNSLNNFENSVNDGLDNELVNEISNMDAKRYDIIVKHEEQVRRLNMIKFQVRKKQEKLEQFNNNQLSNERESSCQFKLNSKGKEIFINKRKK